MGIITVGRAVRGGRARIGRIVREIKQDVVRLEDDNDIAAARRIKAVLHPAGYRIVV